LSNFVKFCHNKLVLRGCDTQGCVTQPDQYTPVAGQMRGVFNAGDFHKAHQFHKANEAQRLLKVARKAWRVSQPQLTVGGPRPVRQGGLRCSACQTGTAGAQASQPWAGNELK